MNKEYLQNVHSSLEVTHDFDTWTSKIKTNDDYLSKLHSKLGVTHDFDTWKQKVIGPTTPAVPAEYKPEDKKQDFTGWSVQESVDGVSMSIFKDPEGNLVKMKDVPKELQDQYTAFQKSGQGEATSFSQFLVDTKGAEEGKGIIQTIDSYKLVGTKLEEKKKENELALEEYNKLIKKRNELNLRVNNASVVEEQAPTVNFGGMRMVDPSGGEVTGNVNANQTQLAGSQSNRDLQIEKLRNKEIQNQNENDDRESLISQINNSRITRIMNEIQNGDHGDKSIVDVMTDEDALAHFKAKIDEAIENDQGILQFAVPESQQGQETKTDELIKANIPNTEFDVNKPEGPGNRKFISKINQALQNNIKSTQYSYGNIVKLEKELEEFEKDYNKNVAPKSAEYKKQFEGLTSQLAALQKQKDALGDVNENSDINLINQWNSINEQQNVLIGEQQGIQKLQEKLFADNSEMIASYKKADEDIRMWVKDYKNRLVISEELIENEKDLIVYHNAIKRNNHNVVAGGAWLLSSGISLASGLEGMVNAVKELPEDILFSFYDNDISKMPNIVKGLKGNDMFNDAMRLAGKEKVNNFINNLNDSVEEVKDFNDVSSVDDLGMFALHGLANFVPQIGLMAATGGASIYVMGASAFGNKFDEMDRSNAFGGTEYTQAEKWLASTITGGSEIISEKITFNLYKGYSGAIKKQIRDRGFKGVVQNFSIGGTLRAGGNTVMEGGSEVYAQLGGNFADILIGKDVNITEGVNGAFFTGLVMERTMALPTLYSKVSPIFMGKDYTETMSDLNAKQKAIGDKIIDPNISSSARDKFEAQWLKVQEKKETLMAKNIENIDQMKGEEKNRLVNIENQSYKLRNEIKAIENDNTIKLEDKKSLIQDLVQEQNELTLEKNKIIQKYESDETREARNKRFEEQTAKIKADIERSNKRRKSPYISERFQSDNKYTEFETRQESLDYFNDMKMKRDAEIDAEIKAMREVLNSDTALPNDKRIAAKNIKYLQNERANTTREAESNASSFGFIVQNKDGSYEVIINKENSLAQGGNVNVAAHEFLHAVLFKSLRGNKEVQLKMGNAVVDYVERNKGGLSPDFINKMMPYAYADNAGEEILTVMSESIMDGTLQFNDGFFTKMGDLIRQNLQRLGWKKIKFNSGRDVYNFIKDYNASIEKGYNSKAIDRLMDFGAEGSLVELDKKVDNAPDQQIQKSTPIGFQNETIVQELGLSEETQAIVAKNKEIQDKILAEGLKDKDGNIMASISLANALVRNNMPRAFALAKKAANKGKDLTLEDALKMDDVAEWFSLFNEKLVKLSRTYRARKNGKEVPFGAYMNAILPKKYSGLLEKAKSKIETDRMSDEATAKKVAKKIAPKKDSNKKEELEGTAIALETIGQGDVMPKLQNVYSKNKNKVTRQKTYKDVKNAIVKAKKEGPYYQALVEVAKIFSEGTYEGKPFKIDPAELAKRIRIKQDLTKPMRKVIQDVILKYSPEMINMVPDGTSTGGDATGIANTKIGKAWYDKKGKTKFAETGSRKGLNIQEKRGLNTQTFLAPFGLGEKGNRTTTKDIDGNLREWIMQVATLAMNQASRQADPSVVSLLSTKDGKNPIQFSTSVVNDLVQVNSVFELEYNGKNKVLNFHGLQNAFDIKSPEGREEFLRKIKEDLFPMFPKEFFFSYNKDGKVVSSIFTASNANYGLSMSKNDDGTFKSPEEAMAYSGFRDAIFELGKLDDSNFGPPIKDADFSKTKTYTTIFGNKDNYLEKMKDKKAIEEWNKNVAIIHEEMWNRFNKAIKKDKQSARLIATYLGLVANDKQAWHRLGAQLAGYSNKLTKRKNGKKPNIEFEHAMPATAAYLYLLDAALRDGVDFKASYDLVVDNYKLIVLDKAMDDKLRNARTKRGYSLQKRMPDNWDLLTNRWLDRYFNDIVNAQDGGINPDSIIALNGKTFTEEHGISFSKVPEFANFDKNATIQKAIQFSKNSRNKVQGITVLDFDDTLATTKSLVKFTTPEGKTGTLNAEQYASTYQDLLEQGYTFDFSDFNKVVGGKLAPLFQKALKLQGKFGPKNMFVLTARPPQAQQAIFDFLKANGLNIPIENITGLANSTSEAKALWIADKVGEGYNDFYFADDALQNVQAVKNMLDQFDVKSKVQQAKIQFSKGVSDGINDIIEQNTGVKKESRFSSAEARARGMDKGKYKLWIPAGAEDFMGLMYTIANAKGKKGEAQLEFIRKSLLEPYNNGIAALNAAKQELSGNYKALLKQHPDIKKLFNKNIEGTNFTYEHAIRVYLWDRAGYEIPGIAEATKKKLLDAVKGIPEMNGFADSLGKITKVEQGYPEPDADWVAESIIADLANVTDEIGRAEFLQEFINNANEMFSEENLKKIEAIYGRDYRDALENMLYRMKTGKNQSSGTTDAQLNRWTLWIRNSVGAIMFLNMRSALLQTISAVNFINWSDNNPIKAAMAFANQKQYWSDFSMIFNSPFLKQRRAGLKTDVNEARLAAAIQGKKNKAKAAIAYLLKIGFTPTQIADSFAIAAGGATFYRNRAKALMKEGMSREDAEAQAFQEMQDVSNVSQQSSDPSLLSRQQTSILGAFVLAFQNTPMQYARITKKAAIDLIKGRGDWKTNVSKIVYYTAVQNLIFNAMQQALFALAFSDDEDEEKELQKQTRLLNGMADSILRGTGIYGAVVATAKNIALEFYKQDLKGGRADHAYTILQFANISPPIGSKLRKLYSATQTRKFNRKAMEQMGYDIYNPAVPAIATGIEAFTNLPTGRLYNKFNNISQALNEENENWQRIALMMGWNTWDLGIKESFKVNNAKSKKPKRSRFSKSGSSKSKSRSRFSNK